MPTDDDRDRPTPPPRPTRMLTRPPAGRLGQIAMWGKHHDRNFAFRSSAPYACIGAAAALTMHGLSKSGRASSGEAEVEGK